MSPQQKLLKNTIFLNLHSEDGDSLEKLNISRQRGITSGTLNQASEIQSQIQDQESIIAESRPTNKRMTSKGKRKSLGKTSRNIKSSKTLGLDSISREKDSLTWWTKSSKELSAKLLSRIGTDSVDLRSISWNGFVNDQIANSWFKTRSSNLKIKNSQKILWPSFTSSLTSLTEKDVTRAKKIRIRPTSEQIKILRKWMEDYRKTWNMALKLVKEDKRKISLDLKKDVVTKRKNDSEKLIYLKSSPAVIRKGAVNDLVKANKSAWALYKAKLKESKSNWRKNPFEIKYKSRKSNTGSFPLDKVYVKKNNDESFSLFNEPKFKMILKAKNVPDINKDCRITCVFDRWYLIVPETTKAIKRDIQEEPKVIGIDPGLRTAFSCLGTDGSIFEIGSDVNERLYKINSKLESIKTRMNTDVSKRSRLKKAWHRHLMRTKQLCDELHWKTINFLTSEYDVIVLGKLNVKSLMMSNNKTNKKLLSFLSFYKFRQRLEEKARSRGNLIIIQNEAGTTQGCPQCGFKKLDVGSSKVYKCDRCSFEGDRDIKSALCMIIKSCS